MAGIIRVEVGIRIIIMRVNHNCEEKEYFFPFSFFNRDYRL